MSRRPSLLFLSHTLPYPPDGGVFIRTYNILRLLAKEYDVRLIAFNRTGAGASFCAGELEESIRALENFATVSVVPVPQDNSRIRFVTDHLKGLLTGRGFTYYRYNHPDFSNLVRGSLAKHKYALVHVDSLDLVGILPLLPLDVVVLTHHNVESDLLRDRARSMKSLIARAYVRRQAAIQEALERHWCPLVRLNVTVSNRDAERLRFVAPGTRVVTVPNGVDTESIVPSAEQGSGILCIGGLGWFPNRDALDYLVDDILPRLSERGCTDLPVTWVGRVPVGMADQYELSNVQLAGYVDDVVPYLDAAACYVMPFRLGGGTRLKLLEAMAAGKAIVSTVVGAMGVEVVHGRDLLIGHDAESIARHIQEILVDPKLRESLGQAARSTAERLYSWESIGKGLLEKYASVRLSGGGARSNLTSVKAV